MARMEEEAVKFLKSQPKDQPVARDGADSRAFKR